MLLLLLFSYSVIATPLDQWIPNKWHGFLPLAKSELTDNTLHIHSVTGKHGYGWHLKTRFDAVAGDTLGITATVKGKGILKFSLRCFSAETGKWLGSGMDLATTQLDNEWQTRTFLLKVDNPKTGVTGQIMPCFEGGNGDELYIKDIKMGVIRGDQTIKGDLMFPQSWQVFSNLSKTCSPPLDHIPVTIENKTSATIILKQNTLSLQPFTVAEDHSPIWLYANLEAPYAGDYTLGAAADSSMTIFLNGIKILESPRNNASSTHFGDNRKTVQLQKGDNILVIQATPDNNFTSTISIGGANELRDISALVKINQFFMRDSYTTTKERPGNPELITDILTDGIETKFNFGYYKAGSVITFPEKKWQLPSDNNEVFFATGARLQRIEGSGTVKLIVGSATTLDITPHPVLPTYLQATLIHEGAPLQSISLPANSLPTDLVLALNQNTYHVNLLSLQDSRLHAMHGRADFSRMGEFLSGFKLEACNLVIGNYFTGLAKCEFRSDSAPFIVDLEPYFDPVKAGWKLIWQDEFEGSEVDWEKTWMNSPWNPVEQNREQAYIKDGKLHIRCDFLENPGGKRPFKGKTVGLYSRERFKYGYFEAKIRLTRKPGWWAAFWMQDEGRNMSVGGGYELDIMEDYSTRRNDSCVVANNLHVTYGPNMRSYGYLFDLPGNLDEFYVFGCKWTPFEFSTYLNGKLIESRAQHSPYASTTYDAINHGFGTSELYLCLSGQNGYSGGVATNAGSEEFVVEYVRAYAYPHDKDPEIKWSKVPAKSFFTSSETFNFAVDASPSSVSDAPVKTVYLFDNGNLVAYKTEPPYEFTLALNEKYYQDTLWSGKGRSGVPPVVDGYTRFFRAAVQDANGKVAHTDPFPIILDMRADKHHHTKPPVVPGKVKPMQHNQGGHNIAYYKQARGGYESGRDRLFNSTGAGMREAGEWISYSVDVKEAGEYKFILHRRPTRRDLWEMKCMVIVNDKYIGMLEADPGIKTATLQGLKLTEGIQNITLISACTYGVWAESLEFVKSVNQ